MANSANEELLMLWSKSSTSETLNRTPLFHDGFHSTNSILLIGINPAYSEKSPTFLEKDDF